MSTNVDERLLGRWLETRERQELMRARLAASSLPVERFEDWALDLIATALAAAQAPRGAEAASVLGPERPGSRGS